MIALLYPVPEETGGELVNTDRIRSLVIGGGPKSASFVSDKLGGDIELAVLVGTAGALAEGLSLGDIVACNKYFLYDGRYIDAHLAPYSLVCRVLEAGGTKFQPGASVTILKFHQEVNVDAIIVDGEDFYVAEVLHQKGIPLAVVRIVSDLEQEKISVDQLMQERIPACGVILREKFVVPFLRSMGNSNVTLY